MRDVRVYRRPMGRDSYYHEYQQTDDYGEWRQVTIESLARQSEMAATTIHQKVRAGFRNLGERALIMDITDVLNAGAAAARRARWNRAAEAVGRSVAKTPREAVLKGHETRRRRALARARGQ